MFFCLFQEASQTGIEAGAVAHLYVGRVTNTSAVALCKSGVTLAQCVHMHHTMLDCIWFAAAAAAAAAATAAAFYP